MKNQFSKKIAKEIAEKQFDQILDCVLGVQDPDLSLNTEIDYFEDSFTEDLDEKNIVVTQKRIEIINKELEKLINNARKNLERLYSDKA